MSNKTQNYEMLRYRDSNGNRVEIRISLTEMCHKEGIRVEIDFKLVGEEKNYTHRISLMAMNLDINCPQNMNAIKNYAKDCVYSGKMSIASEIVLQNKEEIGGYNFQIENTFITYQRDLGAVAIENDVSRWLILEKLYKSDLPQIQIRNDGFHFEASAIAKAVEVLNDLEYIQIIDRMPTIGECNARIMAFGMRFFEEKALPAHNQVFVIAPCKEKWFTKSIKKRLDEIGLRYIIQEEKESKLTTIREDMLANIRSSRFIIADISGRGIEDGERFNPNCVYELGYAHALNKKIICSVNKDLCISDENGSPILPFDFAGVRFSFWDDSSKPTFMKEIKKRIQEVQDHFTREYWQNVG